MNSTILNTTEKKEEIDAFIIVMIIVTSALLIVTFYFRFIKFNDGKGRDKKKFAFFDKSTVFGD